MKHLILSVLLLVATASVQSQVTQLEEANVVYKPFDSKISQDQNRYSFNINEEYVGEFDKNPIGFMHSNFDIYSFMREIEEEYDSYEITFRSQKGKLMANYDKEGELLSTYQNFKDILLPLDIRREVYMKNKGWTMTSNKYVAFGTASMLEKELYKIKLEKDGQKRTLKLDGNNVGLTSVASN
ncbi:hypothetical protein [Gramella sp. AN32]|uniref:GLPGLI family protein n=1 Tax=Christiangramia antarctica TaxID=2058158 RepID=A0ABW5X0L1_9FLAO|nr:hypothetical protein [Gramella sp. AN32]MCM4155684.1 hypothetical protein [Gramella sp. AN32]